MLSQTFKESSLTVQAEILSRILLMKGCRFDPKSVLQRIRIDTGLTLDQGDLDEIETRLGLRGPIWVRFRHNLEGQLSLSPDRLAFMEDLIPGQPAKAGLSFGDLLWECGYQEVPTNISTAWPAFRLILNSAARIAILVRSGAKTRTDAIRISIGLQSRLEAIGMTPLQVADFLMPHSPEEPPDATELLARKRGQKPKWHIPRGTRITSKETVSK